MKGLQEIAAYTEVEVCPQPDNHLHLQSTRTSLPQQARHNLLVHIGGTGQTVVHFRVFPASWLVTLSSYYPLPTQ